MMEPLPETIPVNRSVVIGTNRKERLRVYGKIVDALSALLFQGQQEIVDIQIFGPASDSLQALVNGDGTNGHRTVPNNDSCR